MIWQVLYPSGWMTSQMNDTDIAWDECYPFVMARDILITAIEDSMIIGVLQ